MDLSVVIVNYNVKYFLEQCLYSVQKAMTGIDGEVFVVDNNSVDGSVSMLREKFPNIQTIANTNNVGFSKANNQAIRVSKGKYVLLLNPDTLVEEDTFRKCIQFMDEQPWCGGLGVKMIDGKGQYLQESKRGLPLPKTSFYKMIGLANLFPKSKRFARYYLAHLSPDEVNEVEVLAGAFMLLRKETLDKIGLLDEDFFMYGEDIDLSYRITQSGYKNYYFPETRIIHYKGESTKKVSLNYVYTFYNAMAIFVKKHFSGRHAKLLSFFIKIAIWLAASLSVLKRTVQTFWISTIDFLVVWGGMVLLKNLWAQYRWENMDYYPDHYMYAIPIYAAILLFAVFLCGGYDKPFKFRNLTKGIFAGIIALLVFYSLVGAEQRYSRMLILVDGVWTFTAMSLIRLVLHAIKIKEFQLYKTVTKRYVIVGEEEECVRVESLLEDVNAPIDFVKFVSSEEENKTFSEKNVGNKEQLKEILRIYNIDEVIFCSKSLQPQKIISLMSELQQAHVEYRIAPEDGLFIIGSNSINTTEDLYTIDLNTITRVANKRNKRILDILLSVIFFVFSPVILFIEKNKINYLKNCILVLIGKRSWVGYAATETSQQKLPLIKKGVLTPLDALSSAPVNSTTIDKLNLVYAKDYKPVTDLNIIFKNFRKLGNCIN